MLTTKLIGFLFLLLAATSMAAPAPAPTFPTAAEILTPRALPKGPAPAQYIVAFGKVLGKKTAKGYTRFEYANGQLVSERLPSGIAGSYAYDRQGRFESILYTNGERITATYDQAGRLTALKGGLDQNKLIHIRGKVALGSEDKQQMAGFLTLQEGISAMDYGDMVCIETSDEPCIIDIGNDNDAGSGGAGISYIPRYSGSGGGNDRQGGQGSGIYPATGTAYPDKESCRANVCMGGARDFRQACSLMALNALEYQRCSNKVSEFYFKCQESCGSADWSWMGSFNFFW